MANIGYSSADPQSDANVGYRSHKVARKSVGSDISYWLQGSDVSYNGFTFPPTVRCKATVIPEYSKDRRTIKWHTVALDIECYISQDDRDYFTPGTSYGDTIDPHMERIKKRLMQPCQLLSFTLQGFGNIQVQGASPSGFIVSGDITYDLNYGPNPQALEWEPMGGGLGARIQYLITASIPACSTNNGQQGIVDYWHEIAWSIGDGGALRRTVTGGIELAATRQANTGDIHASAVVNLVQNKAQYKIALDHANRAFPARDGWLRQEDFKVSANKKVLTFTFTDDEVVTGTPYPAGILKISATESLSANNSSFYEWDWQFSAQISVPNPKKLYSITTCKRLAFSAFGMLLKERTTRTIQRQKILSVQTDNQEALTKSKQIVAIPVSLKISNEIFGASINCEAGYLLRCPPSELWEATGMFDIVKSGWTWRQWRKFLEDSGSRVPYTDVIPNAEVIVDLCHPISSTAEQSNYRNESSFGSSMLRPEAPPIESSWVTYENSFKYETEYGTVTGVLLSPNATEMRNDDKLNNEKILNSDKENNLIIGPSIESGSSTKAYTPDFSTASEPITYITMIGRAARIGYPINAPILASIGGTPVVQVGKDVVIPTNVPSGFTRNGKSVPMYGLQWKRTYALTGPPRRNWKPGSNADPAIYK